MNEEDLRAIIDMFSRRMEQRGPEDLGEGDYHDFLANYMHAQNMGGQPDELAGLANGFDTNRLKAMQKYAGGPTPSSNPTTQESRGSLNQLIRSKL